MSRPPVIRHAERLGELQALSDKDLWSAIGACAPGAPVVRQYMAELERRASLATIKAANATRWSAGLAATAIIVAAGVSIWAELSVDPEGPREPIGVYLTPAPTE